MTKEYDKPDSIFSLDSSRPVLLQIRKGLWLTRYQFADKLYTTYASIYAWEHGRSRPILSLAQIKVLDEMLKTLGISWQDLPDNWFPDNWEENEDNEIES